MPERITFMLDDVVTKIKRDSGKNDSIWDKISEFF